MEASCPICFEDLKGKVKASPNTCDHVFCLTCIEKWSKLGTFCPVDRKRFKKIVNLDSESQIQVKPKKRKKEKALYDFSTKCEVCAIDNNDDVLLLCDCCDLAFHVYCLKPAIKTVPAGLWFCPTCISVEAKLKKRNGITKELEADLGNANLHLKGRGGHGDVRIVTRSRKRNSDKESADEATQSNLDKLNDGRSDNNEQCSSIVDTCLNVVSECQNINVAKTSCQDILNYSYNLRNSKPKKETNSCSSECTKEIKTYGKSEKQKKVLKITAQDEMDKVCNSRPTCSSITDICLNNNTSKDESLLDDCLSQAVVYGEMKIGMIEETVNDMYMTGMDKSLSKTKYVHSVESRKLSYNTRFRNKIHEIRSPNKRSQDHGRKIISNEDCFQESTASCHSTIKQGNTNHGDVSGMNDILPSASAESNKEKNVSMERSYGKCHSQFYEHKDTVENITSTNKSRKKSTVSSIKNHGSLNSQNNCFYFNFCQSNRSSKFKVRSKESILSNELMKSREENSSFDIFEPESIFGFDGNDHSNFMLSNLEYSKTDSNMDDRTCKNQLSHVAQSSKSNHESETITNISDPEEKGENFTISCDSVSTADKESSFMNRNDLKYLTIRNDSFYIDLPESNKLETEDNLWNVSNRISSDNQENINASNNVKYTHIETDKNFLLKCSSLRKSKSTRDCAQKSSSVSKRLTFDHENSFESCKKSTNTHQYNEKFSSVQFEECTNKSETSECHNLKHLTIQKDRSRDYSTKENEKSVRDILKESCSYDSLDSSKTLCHSDLKFLTVRSDGTFFLDCPASIDQILKKPDEYNSVKSSVYDNLSKTDALQKANLSDGCIESETLCRNDLKHLTVRKDGTFFLDCSVSKDIKSVEKPVQKFHATSKSRSLYHNDLKHLNIRSDGTFYLDISD